MSNCQEILNSSLTAQVGETVTLRDGAGNQVAIFTHMKTRQGGRRCPDAVAATARLCAAAPELYACIEEFPGFYAGADEIVAWTKRTIAAQAKARGKS